MIKVSRASLGRFERHLADRFTFGIDDEMASQLTSSPRALDWFDAQLAAEGPDHTDAEVCAAWFPLLSQSPQVALALVAARTASPFTIGKQLVGWTFAKRILSRFQVRETMADFWSNLLYVPAGEARSYPWLYDYHVDVIRTHALGRFSDLLQAAIVHPAMGRYLTNDLNRSGGLNENLGREVLELHTVGKAAGFSERMVRDSSTLLSGFVFDPAHPRSWSYDPSRHATGRVAVLGFRHRNAVPDGRQTLSEYLEHLALHPATARRLARRLCVRFASDQPSRRLVRAVADEYLRSGSDIAATLRVLVRHPDFRRARGVKVRNPSDDVVNMCRVLGLRPTHGADDGFLWHVLRAAQRMGHLSLTWPAPDGWPEDSRVYLNPSRLLVAWQLRYEASAVESGLLGGVTAPGKQAELPAGYPITLDDLVDHQSTRLLGASADTTLRRAVSFAVELPRDHTFASAEDVADDVYQTVRGTVLTAPGGLQR